MYKDCEIGSIPTNWNIQKLEELANVTGGKRLPKGSSLSEINNGHPYIRVSDMNDKGIQLDSMLYVPDDVVEQISRYRVDKDDLYISVAGTLGLVGKVPDELNGANLTENADRISNIRCNTDFLLYCLKSDFIKKIINSEMTTNAQPKLALTRIKQFPIPVPPLKEQQKIAEILSSVDAAIEKTEQVIAKTEEVKKGLMQQLLTKGIGHTKFKDSKLGLIPESWNLIDFIEVADSNIDYSFTGGPFGSDLKSEDYTENGVRIIQLQNIKDGYFNDDYKIFTSEEKADKLKSCNIYPGEIIIAKMADPLARACLVPDKDSRYLMASDGIRLSIDKCKFDINFVLYSINSIYFRNQAEEVGTGTTRLRIGLSALKKLQFKVPPLEEQKRISSIILSFDNKIKNEQEKLIKLKNCKKGLMQQLLTGQVRVGALC